jgi:hypothetical protein
VTSSSSSGPLFDIHFEYLSSLRAGDEFNISSSEISSLTRFAGEGDEVENSTTDRGDWTPLSYSNVGVRSPGFELVPDIAKLLDNLYMGQCTAQANRKDGTGNTYPVSIEPSLVPLVSGLSGRHGNILLVRAQ